MRTRLFTALVATLLFSQTAGAAWDPREEAKETAAARDAVARFQTADPTLDVFFDKSYAYAIFPTVGKGAYIVGVGYGRGLLYERGKAVGRTSITQLSAGAQIGGQAYSEIVFFRDAPSLEAFKKGHLELSAQVSAVAVKEGVGKGTNYTDGVAVFLLPKAGLMAEASIAGQRFSFEPF